MEGSVGEVAFNAFVEASQRHGAQKPPVSSGPQFKDLPEEAKTAWQAAGQAVADSTKAAIKSQETETKQTQEAGSKQSQVQGQKPAAEPRTQQQVDRPVHDIESPTKPVKTSGDA